MARFSKSVALDAGVVLETDGGIVLLKDRPDAQIVLRPTEDSRIERIIVPRPVAGADARGELLMQLEDFVMAARDGRAPAVTGRQGLMSLRLIEDLYGRRAPLQSSVEAAGGRVN
jgi:predicted dehydrogenase